MEGVIVAATRGIRNLPHRAISQEQDLQRRATDTGGRVSQTAGIAGWRPGADCRCPQPRLLRFRIVEDQELHRIEPNNLEEEIKNLPKDKDIYLYCT